MTDGQKQKKMNVLLITFDDLRPALGCYNDPLACTPNIDKLAKQGVVFTRAYCQQAVCNPSRASMLTGLRPDEIEVTDLKSNVRDNISDIVTLPQLFKDNGYRTVDVGKIFHGAKATQDGLSWSVPEVHNISVKKEEYYLARNRTGEKEASVESPKGPDNAYIDGRIAEKAIGWLVKFEKEDRAFFLAVGFQKPHFPFCAPETYWHLRKRSDFRLITDREKPVGAPPVAFHHWQELRGYSDIPDSGKLAGSKATELRHAYYSCVSYVDAQVGKIMDTLHELSLDKNTIVVLCSDHGIHLGEQDLWGKATNFELDVRIPLIISAPEVSKRGIQCNKIVESLDVYPTLVDLCKIEPVHPLRGRSLKPFLMNTKAQPEGKVAYSQFCRPYDAIFSAKDAKYMGYTVRCKDWRYTAWYRLESGTIDYKELYYLKGKNLEAVNLSGNAKYAAIESHLLGMLNDYKNKRYTE